MKDRTKAISDYVKEVDKIYRQGQATEHSYRPALKILLEELTTGIHVVNEPKRIDCGAPDYVLYKDELPLGYIEAKDIKIGLNDKNNEEQFNRYKEALGNLILTDYLSFVYYKEGHYIKSISIGKEIDSKIIENKNDYQAFLDVIDDFVKYKGIKINNSEKLARTMASKTKLLAELIRKTLKQNKESSLSVQKETFKQYLIHDLDDWTFADIYSQTIAYGLFAAKLYDTGITRFSRYSVADLLPKSNPFLKQLYHFIMGPDIEDSIKWLIDSFADMFNVVDINAIKKQFEEKDADPYIHFYETFLNEYDKQEKKDRGVYYTPSAVVKFIVNSVDEILKTDFELPKGLADNKEFILDYKDDKGNITEQKKFHKVQILDPATGTGTFLAEVIDKIYSYYKNNNQGLWNGYCEKDLIKRIHGFEYMMASYTMAHLKIDMKLKETGFDYNSSSNERLGIYLTNTLEEPSEKTGDLGIVRWLTDEATAAQTIKTKTPVMVVLGNPPYNVKSKNKFDDEVYINYKKEPGGIHKLEERTITSLNDDYVKFIAYGHRLIKKYNEGVLAYITNNSFLDNLTFRGMRWSLLNTFDKIYILNLHGDQKNDENVFNILQSVSINIFVKNNKKKENQLAEVYYSELIGKRKDKYEYLQKNDLQSIKWKKVKYDEPHYFFTYKTKKKDNNYNEYFSINDMFNSNTSSGVETGRDPFTIKYNKKEMIETINKFLELDNEQARNAFNLGDDTTEWNISNAKKDLVPNKEKNPKPDFSNIIEMQYRPFDIRYTYYTGNSKGFHRRPAKNINRHFLIGENIGLVTCRQLSVNKWDNILVTKNVTEACYVSNRSKEKGYVYPLYLYPFEDKAERQVNLNMEIIQKIEEITKLKYSEQNKNDKTEFEPVDIVYYIYAVLFSPAYRKKFNDELIIDYPRIKYPKDEKEFKELIKYGKLLSELHLMENINNSDIINYPIDGTNKVEKIKYINEKVMINDKQYFEKIPKEIWDYLMGSYQPAEKWLKDRKNRVLSYDDIQHYKNIIYVLSETIKLQKKIDEVIDI